MQQRKRCWQIKTGRQSSFGVQISTARHGRLSLQLCVSGLSAREIFRCSSDTMKVAEEIDVTTRNSFLDKLACLLVAPESSHERSVEIGLVVLAHDLLDVDRSFSSVVKWNGGDEMMADMSANDIVEEVSVNEAQVPVNRCCRTTCEIPGLVVVVR